MKLAEALLQGLLDHGVQQLFGIPGDFALPLFKATQAWGKLPLHTLSHEPGVGFAADAAARIASAPAAALVTYGAGALNMVNAVASAYAEQVPLVVVSGELSDMIATYAIDADSGALKPIGRYPTGKGSNWVEIVAFD